MSHKQKVSLIMKRHHLTATKLGCVREERAKKPADTVAQASVEIVEDEFRNMGCGLAMVLDLGARHDIGNLEEGSGPMGKVGDEKAVTDFRFLAEDKDVRESTLLGVLANGLDLETFPGIEKCVGDQLHEVANKMKELPGRAGAGSNENLCRLTAHEVSLKFIFCFVGQDLFVLRMYHCLVYFSGVVQCAGYLDMPEGVDGGGGCEF